MTKTICFRHAMGAPVIAWCVLMVRFSCQLRLMTVIAAAVTDLISILLAGVILDRDGSMMSRAFPTAFPSVEEWACQHDRCHDDGNDLL